jgi:hypothetical protein
MPEPTNRASEASIRDLLRETIRLYHEEGRYPGPWEDCSRVAHLVEADPQEYRDLYPDLVDVWGDVIAGTCSFGEEILSQSEEWLLDRRKWLSQPFFDFFQKYRPLQPFVTEAGTPALCRELTVYETLRVQLLRVIDWALEECSN